MTQYSNTLRLGLSWYALEPIDILLFREAKPFSPGDGSWAKGQFPPLPITVFQALRTAFETDTNYRPPDLGFLGPFLLSDQSDPHTLWLPTPRDLLAMRALDSPHQDDLENEDLEQTRATWDGMARFQPETHPVWVTSQSLAPQSLASMVPPALPDLRPSGPPPTWMRAEALLRYLQGHTDFKPTDFTADPWDWQVLPHIAIQSGTRQVKTEGGYFTEVAARLRPGWQLVAALAGETLTPLSEPTTIRLGGEGHRVLVTHLGVLSVWQELANFLEASDTSRTAYLLTPGLAEVAEDAAIYGVYPQAWQADLLGCMTDRPLYWGGIARIKRKYSGGVNLNDFGLGPQRAHVKPGTIYRFKHPPKFHGPLVPTSENHQIFQQLHYGTLLWGV